jgi:hypothetical protein
VTASAGNGRLIIGYAEDKTDNSLTNTAQSPAHYDVTVSLTDGTIVSSHTFTVGQGGGAIDGLENGTTYNIQVTATDIAGNVSEPSDIAQGTPVLSCDFWSCYPGQEKGGFCFIATAAYGSYDAPFVQTFRDFRDQVLLRSALGRDFVRWYYKHGAAPAIYIAQRPFLRSLVAAGLLVPYAAVWPIVHLRPVVWALGFLMLLGIGFWFGRRALLVLLVLVVMQSTAAAEELVRGDPFDPRSVTLKPPRAEFAAKIGPYYPAIDRDADAANFYSTFFGSTQAGLFSPGSKIKVQLSADIYLLNTIGLLGFTGTAGFWEAVGRGRTCQASDDGMGNTCDAGRIQSAPLSNDSTVLNLFPFSLGVVYKFDWFWRRWKVPLVPFVRAGFDVVFWNVQAATKQARKNPGDKYVPSLLPNNFAQGATYGWHVNPGLMIALDWIEPNAARSAYTFTGMKGSYLTFEWNFSYIDDFGKAGSWDLSASTFLAGLAVEF